MLCLRDVNLHWSLATQPHKVLQGSFVVLLGSCVLRLPKSIRICDLYRGKKQRNSLSKGGRGRLVTVQFRQWRDAGD